jgi:uncharacterized membrane protein YoaK (UPF0700 family)
MAITLHTPDTIYSPRHTPSWFALACAAGAVNGFAFLTCEQFVSHVTGTATRIGLEWHHLGIAAEYLIVFVCFLAGAVASVIWIQARAYRGQHPQWASPLILVAIILCGTAIAGHRGLIGPAREQLAADPPPVVLLSLLAFAMGLQNAAVASTTGLAVRTTHLTGPTTDLGIHLGTAFYASGPERKAAIKGAVLRGGKILAFILGGGLSLPLADWFGYLSLLVPAALVVLAAALSFAPPWSPSDFPFRIGGSKKKKKKEKARERHEPARRD